MERAPATFGFSAEYLGDHPAYDDFDDYLRIEFASLHPGWEPRFGKVSWFDPAANRYDHSYLLTGGVPEAASHADAESKVRDMLDGIGNGLASLGAKTEKALERPIVRVWKR